MISRRRYEHILALYPQTRGFAFALFEGLLVPVDWGIREARGPEKNARCLRRIKELLTLYSPDAIVLQDVPQCGDRRKARIHELHYWIVELAESEKIPTHLFTRDAVLSHFAQLGATSKQAVAETIGKHVPALRLYVPARQRSWKNQHPHLGIFEAAALAWMYFESAKGKS
ncbi:hypothetical protein [Bradyrhizobium japonicum]|uniref:hypothetical protein n=1 Tax=Bradyrhizobium japonicum TaxID=375 RepID=UPI001BA7E3DA|nr:hypothetical protein [Bradyrhizobium japonicum]MBR0960905.1 hypothetical protein [Bradyrhizobium japonicum]